MGFIEDNVLILRRYKYLGVKCQDVYNCIAEKVCVCACVCVCVCVCVERMRTSKYSKILKTGNSKWELGIHYTIPSMF